MFYPRQSISLYVSIINSIYASFSSALLSLLFTSHWTILKLWHDFRAHRMNLLTTSTKLLFCLIFFFFLIDLHAEKFNAPVMHERLHTVCLTFLRPTTMHETRWSASVCVCLCVRAHVHLQLYMKPTEPGALLS